MRACLFTRARALRKRVVVIMILLTGTSAIYNLQERCSGDLALDPRARGIRIIRDDVVYSDAHDESL